MNHSDTTSQNLSLFLQQTTQDLSEKLANNSVTLLSSADLPISSSALSSRQQIYPEAFLRIALYTAKDGTSSSGTGGTGPIIILVVAFSNELCQRHASHFDSPPWIRWSLVKACSDSGQPDPNKWMAPPHGWVTNPPQSNDPGGGAWDTLMIKLEQDHQGRVQIQDDIKTKIHSLFSVFSCAIQFQDNAWQRGGFACVLRSHDSASWWKTSHQNCFLPFPASLLNQTPKESKLNENKAQGHSSQDHKHHQPHNQLHHDQGYQKDLNDALKQEQEICAMVENISLSSITQDLQQLWNEANGTEIILIRKWPRADLVLNRSHSQHDLGKVEAWLVNDEHKAQRSLMHRYNIGSQVIQECFEAQDSVAIEPKVQALLTLYVWLRFTAQRLLVWNHNYNVKPREISAAQLNLLCSLQRIAQCDSSSDPNTQALSSRYFALVRAVMSTLGAAAEGAAGQRIRDEILVVQRDTGFRGGMMEEWHQKLHNNASPDDIIICEALLHYVDTAPKMDINAYWNHLQQHGITEQTLRSYDRAVRSPPNFSPQACPQLKKSLSAYLKTLKAVFAGADLESAVNRVLGYQAPAMKGVAVRVEPVPEIVANQNLVKCLRNIVKMRIMAQELRKIDPQQQLKFNFSLIANAIKCRLQLQYFCAFIKPTDRWIDVTFLDLALENLIKIVTEEMVPLLTFTSSSSSFVDASESKHEDPQQLNDQLLVESLRINLANLALSSSPNNEFVICLNQLRSSLDSSKPRNTIWALRIDATVQRLYLALGAEGQWWVESLSPLCSRLGVAMSCDAQVCSLIPEEMVRSGCGSALAQLLPKLVARIRDIAQLGPWQVVSVGKLRNQPLGGKMVWIDQLLLSENEINASSSASSSSSPGRESGDEHLILLAQHVHGEADIPKYVDAVVTLSAIDVLSHIAIRARNESKALITCFDKALYENLKSQHGSYCILSVQGSNEVSLEKKE